MLIKARRDGKCDVHKASRSHVQYNTMFGNKVVNHEALVITKSTDALCQSQANLIEKLCKAPSMSYIYVINNMTVYT